MKTLRSLRPLFSFILLVAALGAGFESRASDAAKESKDAREAKPAAPRAPLKINVDRHPINREAADRISYAPIVKKTSASVVYVYSTKKVRGQDLSPLLNDPMLRRFFGNQVPRGGKMPEQTQRGLGSGIVITEDGYVLTNNHVVEGADDVKVSIGESSKRYDATVVGRDALADVAVLKIDATGLSPATFGDSDQLQVGDVVLAIGDPFGLGQSVSRGIVSAKGRGPGIEENGIEDFIQTDAAINPGNSGGALLDTDGRVVGINTALLSASGGFAGVGFAIPINLARSSAEQIVATGKVERGFLGVAPQDITEDLGSSFKVDKGALISDVTPGTPADKAGLKAGDVITKINDTEIRDSRHLLLTVSQFRPDTKVTIAYIRDGKPQTTTATLTRRTEDSATREDNAAPKDEGVLNGVGVDDIKSDVRQQLDIPPRIKGAIITSIEPDSPSARQGLREGDVILSLDQRQVENASEAVKLSAEIKGPKVLVNVWRSGRTRFFVIDESQK
ncbi:MAG TPA: Do family serine endopeptidase [Opitutaceae bacterium]|nr:Do family serine endopeptidase [Opitutaceae bacterium]